MTAGVVDGFETVQVHIQHRQLLGGAGGPGQGMVDPFNQQRPIGQPGQRIVQRLVTKLVLKQPTLGHVAIVDHHSSDVGVPLRNVASTDK
jgi:hypothetical protein